MHLHLVDSEILNIGLVLNTVIDRAVTVRGPWVLEYPNIFVKYKKNYQNSLKIEHFMTNILKTQFCTHCCCHGIERNVVAVANTIFVLY